MITPEEDVHFLIDNAPPTEVELVLRCLDHVRALSTEDIRILLERDWSHAAQRNLSFSTRRLADLGLASKVTTEDGKQGHVLTNLGTTVRSILSTDGYLYSDLMHYLHYDGYDGTPAARKLFWSYKRCCEVIWARRSIVPTPELVAQIQSDIATQFPYTYSQRVGGNFNAGGVSSWKSWLARLTPPPFSPASRELTPRTVERFQLAVLALDHIYRARSYRYGDPVILDDGLLDDLAGVFFLDRHCYRTLLSLAAKMTRAVRLADTFAGTSVTLLRPYGVDEV